MIRLVLSLLFRTGSCIRTFLYNRGIFKKHIFNTHIISIGNLSMGGSGKTPLLVLLTKCFRESKLAVVEKGYRSDLKRGDVALIEKSKDMDFSLYNNIGDEPVMLLQELHDGTRLAVCSDKTRAVYALLAKWPDTEIIFIDDAFQHLKLHRDVDIVLIDASTGFSEKLFPKGRLREPYSSLKRADIVMFTRAEYVGPEDRENLIELARSYNNSIKIFFSTQRFHTSKAITGKRVLPVSAIANHEYFHKNLVESGAVFKNYISFRDHHKFCRHDYDYIRAMVKKLEPEYVVMTKKDIVKLVPKTDFTVPIVASWYEHLIENEEDFLCSLYPER